MSNFKKLPPKKRQTYLDKLISEHFATEEQPYIEDFTNTFGWRYAPTTHEVFYYLHEKNQILSTLKREPVYCGDEIFSEKWIESRFDIEEFSIFEGPKDCFSVFLKENELITRAWWLFNEKYSNNWNNAKWIEIL